MEIDGTLQMNGIIQKQLEDNQLDRLAAQRQIYSGAKKNLIAELLLTLPFPLCAVLLKVFGLSIEVFATFYSIIVLFLGILFFSPFQNSLKEKAAKIQELFDCDVLEMEWNELKVGQKPDVEEITEAAEKIKKSSLSYDRLKNWYCEAVGKIPLPLARIICQRINCHWDASQRKFYANSMLMLFLSLALMSIFIGLSLNLTIEVFLMTVIVPLIPASEFMIRQFKEHLQAADKLKTLKDYIQRLWNDAVSEKLDEQSLTTESRHLQDEIYDCRCRNPLIFDWLYDKLKMANERQTVSATEIFVKEAIEKVGLTSGKISS